jgi:hypothetical protein
VLIISRDIGIVLTVAIVNLAVGPRTFRRRARQSGTAIYIVTAVAALFFNYSGLPFSRVRSVHLRVARRLRWHPDWTTSGTLLESRRAAQERNVMNASFCWLPFSCRRAVPTDRAVAAAAGRGRDQRGTFVIDLAPDAAPNQTAYFIKQAATAPTTAPSSTA